MLKFLKGIGRFFKDNFSTLKDISSFATTMQPIVSIVSTVGGSIYEHFAQTAMQDRFDQQQRDQAAGLKAATDLREQEMAEERRRYDELQAQTEAEGQRRASEEANLATIQGQIRDKFITNRNVTMADIESNIKDKTDFLYDRIDENFEGRKEQIAEDTNKAIQRVRHNPRRIATIQTGKQNQLNQVEQEKIAAHRDLDLQISGQAQQVFQGMQQDAYNALNASGNVVQRQNAASDFLLNSRQAFIQQSTQAADKIMAMDIGGIQAKTQAFQQGEAIKRQGYVNPFAIAKKGTESVMLDILRQQQDQLNQNKNNKNVRVGDGNVRVGDGNTNNKDVNKNIPEAGTDLKTGSEFAAKAPLTDSQISRMLGRRYSENLLS